MSVPTDVVQLGWWVVHVVLFVALYAGFYLLGRRRGRREAQGSSPCICKRARMVEAWARRFACCYSELLWGHTKDCKWRVAERERDALMAHVDEAKAACGPGRLTGEPLPQLIAQMRERLTDLEGGGASWAQNAEHFRREAARLTSERDEAQRKYEGACETVALMHAAAVGAWGGPVHRGVVEDVAHVRAALRLVLPFAQAEVARGPAASGWEEAISAAESALAGSPRCLSDGVCDCGKRPCLAATANSASNVGCPARKQASHCKCWWDSCSVPCCACGAPGQLPAAETQPAPTVGA